MLQFLASDLISEILRHFLPELQLPVTQPHLFPWYLGQICSVWRRIFISSPPFWSNIKIDMDVSFSYLKNFTEKRSSRVIELLKLALERSNRCPLSLSITMHLALCYFSSTSVEMCCIETLKILVSHSMRWKYLCICLSSTWYSRLSGVKGHLPILRSLKVPRGQLCFSDIFMDATQLTRISLGCMADRRIKFNWSLVTELHLVGRFTLFDVIFIIRQTNGLEKLVIALAVLDWNMCPDLSETTSLIVHLPSLKELYISALIPLAYLRTPLLEALQIGLHPDSERPGVEGLAINNPSRESLAVTLSDYFRTVHNLQKLEIYTPIQEDAQLVYDAAPISIQELKLHDNHISRQLSLVARCPNLYNIKTISVVTAGDDIPMVSTWIIPFKQLARFSLDIGQVKDHEVQVLKRLKNIFEKRGIKFVSRIITDQDLRGPMHSVF